MSVRSGPTEERLALYELVRTLRDDGLLIREIAEEVGYSRQYVSQLLHDPDGSKGQARKDGYRGVCETCGAPTDGSNGTAKAPAECLSCMAKRLHEERYWTRDRIVKAIRRFHRENGRKPLATEWLYGKHGKGGDGYPYTSSVLKECGSWNAAIEAAGFTAEPPGKYVRSAETRKRMSAASKAWFAR